MSLTPLRTAAVFVLGLVLTGVGAPAALAAPAADVTVAADANAAPASVTIVVPLSVPEGKTGLISALALADYTSPTGILTRELNAVIDTPAAIAIDPMIIASIRVLGSTAPASALEWLTTLSLATNDTFALTYADSGITLGLQAGSAVPLAPTAFDFAIDTTLFAAAPDDTDGTPATPTTPPQEGALPPYPTTEALLDWNYTVPGVAWPAANTVTTADLATLAANGYTTTILDSANVTAASSGSAVVSLDAADADIASAIVADAALTALFNQAVAPGTGVEWQAALATLATAITALPSSGGSDGATVLLTLDRGVVAASNHLRSTILSLTDAAGAQALPLSALVGADPTAATLVEAPQSAARISAASSMLVSETLDDRFSVIAERPELITSERRLELLATLGLGWNRNPGGWASAVDDYLNASTDLRDSVKIVQSSSLVLTFDRGSLPVQVDNALDQAVTVYVTVRPKGPLLAVENTLLEVTIEPDSQNRANVPVQSLSNGTVVIDVSLHASSGTPIGQIVSVSTNVQAGWETPVTIALGIIVALIFAGGLYRTVLRRRKSAAKEPE